MAVWKVLSRGVGWRDPSCLWLNKSPFQPLEVMLCGSVHLAEFKQGRVLEATYSSFKWDGSV